MAKAKTAPVARPPMDGDSVPADMFELVARALNVAYYEWLPATDELRMSAALTELFGFDAGSFTVADLLALMHPDDAPGYRAAMRQFFKSDADRGESTYRIKVPGGRYRWARNQHLVQRDLTGRVRRMVGAVSDITLEKQREAENRALIARQAASIEILKAISASPDDTRPVFELIAKRARALCGGAAVVVTEYDGALLHLRAIDGDDQAAIAGLATRFPWRPGMDTWTGRAVLSGQRVHVRDTTAVDGIDPASRALGYRCSLAVPLLRDGRVIGAVALGRAAPGGFDDGEVGLIEAFAEQAVIAITGATALRELRARTGELAARNSAFGEQIEHQSATIDVLKAMSASPADAQPVFDLITRRALEICDGEAVALFQYDGTLVHMRSVAGFADLEPGKLDELKNAYPMRPSRRTTSGRVILDRQVLHLKDMQAEAGIMPALLAMGIRSQLGLPLLRDGEPVGAINLNSRSPGGFTDSQIALLKTFAEQAVIAIRSAETFRELQQRTGDLSESLEQQTATAEVLKVISRSAFDLQTVLDTLIAAATRLCNAREGIVLLREGDLFQARAACDAPELFEFLKAHPPRPGRGTLAGRVALTGTVHNIADITADPEWQSPDGVRKIDLRAVLGVPLLREGRVEGVLLLNHQEKAPYTARQVELATSFADQAVIAIENARLFQDASRARRAAETALADLHRAQDRLVQTEKMASLGQLTAGIAHEIKNPLNFVNNFSDLSVDLLDELLAALAPAAAPLAPGVRAEVDDVTALLKSNLRKISEHGRRADGIVKNMLLHSRDGGGERRSVDLNATAEEALNLAYHGARAEQPGFNISLVRHLDPAVGSLELHPQEFTRVLLNLFSNAFYAASRRQADAGPGFQPTITIATELRDDHVAVRVRDNGIGIPEDVRTKMFDPFFTTKPPGEGTGLGLSLSHDIIVKQHGGAIAVDSRVGEFTEFTITLPRNNSPRNKSGAVP